jgi:enoyl-CoA hydratase/carnithine racemase
VSARTLIYETGERIARLTLNRPERGNGLNPQLIGGLA